MSELVKFIVGGLGSCAVSLVAVTWLAGHRDEIINSHEARIRATEERAKQADIATAPVPDLGRRIGWLEQQLGKQGDAQAHMSETLARIDERIQFLIEQFAKNRPAVR